MRRAPFIAIVCCAGMIGGCTKPAPKAAETATGEVTPQPAPVVSQPAAPAPAPAPAALTAADLAGRWNINATPEWNDTLVTHLVLNAIGDPKNWTIDYPPNPKPMKVQKVMFAGDSMVLDWGPYKSARRKGLKAVSHDVYRLQGGKLVGNSVSHYVGAPADSIARLRLEGTKAP